jgi:hypothetical protein
MLICLFIYLSMVLTQYVSVRSFVERHIDIMISIFNTAVLAIKLWFQRRRRVGHNDGTQHPRVVCSLNHV